MLDGRDIGTVVCPDADVKIYVTATPEVRAKRRYLEMKGRGEPATYEAVLADIRRRDERDASRGRAPMRPAADAFLLDTSNLDIEAAFDTAVGVILEEGWPTRAHLKGVAPIQVGTRPSPAAELNTSWARSWACGPRAVARHCRYPAAAEPVRSATHERQEQE